MEGLRAGPLVRAICSTGVAIWTEWNYPCEVTLSIASPRADQGIETFSATGRTVTVGGHHYALIQVSGLQPATWYNYRLGLSEEHSELAVPLEEALLLCFRTLDLPTTGSVLRLAYGSCRRLSELEPDALSAFGFWLRSNQDEREALWPHILLLIGDQIYADDPFGSQARSFEDFSRLYVEAWTGDAGVRQVLAALPTSMIFDDHEITNNWNIVPMWQAWALRNGFEQTIVDGLAAYWIYQGWGNLGLQDTDEHDLLALMRQAEQSGEDALEMLRMRIRQAIYLEKGLQWDYTLPTMPPIFVADLRADRSVALDLEHSARLVPRIMSQEQMARMRNWAREHEASTILLVSSVPALLPPAIGFAEYVMGVPPLGSTSSGFVHRLAQLLSTAQQRFSRSQGFEHWPVFTSTWRELIALFTARKQDMYILSGDVHFSYAIVARSTFLARKGGAALYQLVASPFRNSLGAREKRLVLGQSWIKRGIYGGLHTRLLPLLREKGKGRVSSDMLLQNVVALVTCSPRAEDVGTYDVQQVYMGVVEQRFVKIATIPLD